MDLNSLSYFSVTIDSFTRSSVVVSGHIARSGANVTYSAANRMSAFSDKGRSIEMARKLRVIAHHVSKELPPS